MTFWDVVWISLAVCVAFNVTVSAVRWFREEILAPAAWYAAGKGSRFGPNGERLDRK